VWKLNGIEIRIQFTLEVEKEEFLPFLDVQITKSQGMYTLVMKVYKN
jgi:hypothetical protein